MILINLIKKGHHLIKDYLKKSDTILDATLGNGNDTLFIAPYVLKVISFDIQDIAIKRAKEKLKNIKNVKIIKDNHKNIANYNYTFNGAIFNLGYLPGGDKNIMTNYPDVISSLNILIKQETLRFILITLYPKSNLLETKKVLEFFKNKKIETYSDKENPLSPVVVFYLK